MSDIYRLEQAPDGRWAVIVMASGNPVRLAGIPQTGLTLVEAQITLDMLSPAARAEPDPRDQDRHSRAA